MNKSEIRQNAIEFLDKRTKQKENLVISRNEAISGLCDFYETLQANQDQSKLLLADVSNRRELLIAFQSWKFDKGYLYQKNLQNGMIEEFLKSNL